MAGYEYRKFQNGATPTWLPLRFPGQYYDAETDLFQNWNRFYDPQTGRFIAPDPLWLKPKNIIALSKQGRSTPVYAYAGNNPVTSPDPTGFATRVALQGIIDEFLAFGGGLLIGGSAEALPDRSGWWE